MPHYRLLFPSKYVAACDLKGDTTVTIESLKINQLETENGPEDRPVMRFRKHTKGMVLNKTNAKKIAKLYGPETNDWVGQRIILFPTTCEAFGDTVECIRVRMRLPKQQTQQSDVDKSTNTISDNNGSGDDYDYENGEVPPEDEPSDEDLEGGGV